MTSFPTCAAHQCSIAKSHPAKKSTTQLAGHSRLSVNLCNVTCEQAQRRPMCTWTSQTRPMRCAHQVADSGLSRSMNRTKVSSKSSRFSISCRLRAAKAQNQSRSCQRVVSDSMKKVKKSLSQFVRSRSSQITTHLTDTQTTSKTCFTWTCASYKDWNNVNVP
jgi:hypothetical protein